MALSLLTRWLSLRVAILDIDEAAHAVGSWVLLDGGRLYTDFVDNKPPLLYAYYALAQLVLGRGLMAVHLFTVLASVPLVAIAVSAVFRHERRGVVAALLWLVYGASFLAHDMLSVNAELVLLLPAAWAIALAADERRATRAWPLVAAGLLIGLATLAKHPAMFWLPALAWAAVRARPDEPSGRPADGLPRGAAASNGSRLPAPWRAPALAAGFALPIAGTWAWFAATGGAHDVAYWLLWRNAVYAANPISLGGALGRAARYLLPWLLATAPLWWAWSLGRRELDPHRRRLIDGLVWLGVLPTFAGFRFFPHYFVPVVFALSLGAAPAVERWTARPVPRAGRVFLGSTLALAVGFAAANAWLWLGEANVYRERDPVYRRVAERLAADACFEVGSRLFVWGWAPAFYYEAGLRGARPASRFSVLAAAGLTGYVPGNPDGARRREPDAPAPSPAHWDLLMADLARTPPTYVVDTAPAGTYRWDRYPLSDYARLGRYVADGYEWAGDVDRVRLYRRRGCTAR